MFHKLVSCLSSNSKKVLAELLNHDFPVSAQSLADSLGLSIYQVRYSVKKIQACLVFNEIEILQKPNEGILIVLDETDRKEILDVVQNELTDFNSLKQVDRVKLLIQIILTSSVDLTQQEIRDLAEISYTSFYRDMDKVRDWLKTFSLTLSSKRNGPLRIHGSELKIRNAIQEILFQNLGLDFLIQACVLPVEDIETCDIDRSAFIYQIQEFINSINLPLCETQIRNLENKYKGNFFDRVHIELTLYLGIMVARIMKGNCLNESGASQENIRNSFGDDAEKILDTLLNDESQRATEAEKQYFAYLLSQCFQYGVSSDQSAKLSRGREKESHALAAEIVKEIAKYLHASLYEDRELIECVEWELAYSLKKKDFKDVTIETLIKSESLKSSTEQTLYKIITPILKKEGIVNTYEIIQLISTHTMAALDRVRSTSLQRRVLLVCGSGVATAFSLKSQLNTQLPEIDVVEMVSVFELAHNIGLADECDAIISTVPLGNITSVPQILVNSLLTPEDINKIKNELGLKEYLAILPDANAQFNFNEIIDTRTIVCGVEADQPMEVIDKVGSLLFDIDAIWPSYIKAMKNLYSLYGPYMVIAPNTTLLHAGPEMGSKKLAISLITLKKPINFGHKVFDPVRIAMAFSSPVNSVHTKALSSVFTFFSIPQNREKIIQAETAEKILAVLGQPEIARETQ